MRYDCHGGHKDELATKNTKAVALAPILNPGGADSAAFRDTLEIHVPIVGRPDHWR